MKHLYFCRHGESELNRVGLFAGHTETPLTETGRSQAKREGQKAKGHGIQLIVSSPLERAQETAQIIAQEIGINPADILVDPILIERHYGIYEAKPYHPDIKSGFHPSIENDDSVIERAKQAKAWLETLPADVILVVSHGSFGRCLRTLYLHNVPLDQKIPNAEMVQFL